MSTELEPQTSGMSWNVAALLDEMARLRGSSVAIAAAKPLGNDGRRDYQTMTFAELAADSSRIAAGLANMGVRPGTRLALLVRPGIDFVSLVFALFKVGAVSVLLDPGMGRRNLLKCLDQIQPEGFVAIPPVHAVRVLSGRRFAAARLNVTVGSRWFWGGSTMAELRQTNSETFVPFEAQADDPAAVIFTSGSTGPPKGVEFRHEGFRRQVEFIQRRYKISPGDIDVQGFPLFGLFNGVMGVTSVIPEMDFSRPAKVNPRHILEAVHDWEANQAFASPAVWHVVGEYCQRNGLWMPSLRRILSAGAPVPPSVLRQMRVCAPHAEMFTPYGATEALPVASISAQEVLGQTAANSADGAGTCVGTRFEGIEWKVIAISDEPIATLSDAETLPAGEIGELIVAGPVVTRRYVTSESANRLSKIAGGDRIWHRMGDVGYLDETDRFWFCGRKAHRVVTTEGTLFTVPVEAIFNSHEDIFRSALVGVGAKGEQVPVVVVQPVSSRYPNSRQAVETLYDELRARAVGNPLTASIQHFLVHPSFPVDVRHNSKISREKLAEWATARLSKLVPVHSSS